MHGTSSSSSSSSSNSSSRSSTTIIITIAGHVEALQLWEQLQAGHADCIRGGAVVGRTFRLYTWRSSCRQDMEVVYVEEQLQAGHAGCIRGGAVAGLRQQPVALGSSSALHSEACNALAASNG